MTHRLRYRSIAFGLELIGLIENALRPAISPWVARPTNSSSFLRKRACVFAEKSGVAGNSPRRAASSIAARFPICAVVRTGLVGAARAAFFAVSRQVQPPLGAL